MMQAAPTANHLNYDALIIGGGFYGCAIAIYLARQRGLKNILLVEREGALMQRASYNNQARVHNGYHYPRSFTTAYRSRINLPQFVRDWPLAVKKDFTKLYPIARRNSKVTAKQFERFCHEIGASLEPADASLKQLFEPRLIEEVFLAEEYAFDSTTIAKWAAEELADCDIQVLFDTFASGMVSVPNDRVMVTLDGPNETQQAITARYVFNCTYSGLNQIGGEYPGTVTRLKHEVAEMALMRTPPQLTDLGITVMDGPFFSMMPFPARGLHTLSHVRYTPHLNWPDAKGTNPYDRLDQYPRETRVERMVRDVERYMPAVADAEYVDSLFEIKTVLVKNEGDDGRPILFEKHASFPSCYSVLGGKLDNIFDVLEKLDAEAFQ
ncbi:NAD(P)/FAD-dependent oxidoreductase [Amantichitinum ursilacus]|uniref:FAD dependent oxidoreductase n=1 Tax=Amantichitinum ursilacus TaxID=857265 RepID=A0A0N1JS56_9NEIS|nr:FAD-dependent oxidoreductase [Amantichitinum ursilacus]KPC50402.1 FAD dependent oxidoreductase [Amantichitinum ursilacus]